MNVCPDLDYIEARGFYRDRKGETCDLLVIHITAGWGNSERLGKFFENPVGKGGKVRQTSAHLGLGRKGDAAQFVPLDGGAWHAGGKSSIAWDGKRNVNLRSVGIELCNRGSVKQKIALSKRYARRAPFGFVQAQHLKSRRLRYWEQFGKPQLDMLAELLPWILAECPDVRYVCGHEDLVPGKMDPGPLFPWSIFPWEGFRLTRMEKDWKTGRWFAWQDGKRRPWRPGDA